MQLSPGAERRQMFTVTKWPPMQMMLNPLLFLATFALHHMLNLYHLAMTRVWTPEGKKMNTKMSVQVTFII